MTDTKRRICVILVDRANYGRLQPVMRSIQEHPRLELVTLVAGTMVLDRFGRTEDLVREDGFAIDGRLHTELEGSTPVTMAKSVGFGVIEFAGELQRLAPDIVLVIGDRYEALSAVVAAAFMNLTIAHVQGGEVSGSIDESTRHAITKYAHYHFPATERAAEFINRMGEPSDSVLTVGCPSADLAADVDLEGALDFVNQTGSGAKIDDTEPFLLCTYHPTTTRYGHETDEMLEILGALHRINVQTLMLWPNIDAGSDRISKEIRRFRDHVKPDWLRIVTNVQPGHYLRVLGRAAVALGNSSSFVRDSSHFGTPVVLVGDRQNGREWGRNVRHVPPVEEQVHEAVCSQLTHGRYAKSALYGQPGISDQIAEALATAPHTIQKSLDYVRVSGP